MANCILCEAKALVNRQDYASRDIYNCPNCGMFVVSEVAEKDIRKHSADIAAFLTHRKIGGNPDKSTIFFSFDGASKEKEYLQFTVGQLVRTFPRTLTGRIDRALENLAIKSTFYGEEISIDGVDSFALLYAPQKTQECVSYILKTMQKSGYIAISHMGAGSFFPCTVTLTLSGWHHVEASREGKQGNENILLVIAPSGETDGESYLSEAEKAAQACHYRFSELKTDARLGNAGIAQIRAAKILLCDLSDGSPLAYYAAGMARALGKTVILTCQDQKIKKLDIDTDQIGVLSYESQDDIHFLAENAIKARF